MLNMKLSPAGADALKRRESRGGIPDLVGYWDHDGGVPTAGWGHTGEDVIVGKTYPPEQCNAWFDTDTGWAVTAANNAITNDKITQNQFDAFVSALYNIGVGVKGSHDGLITLKSGKPSTVLSLINSDQMDKVPGALLAWVHDEEYPAGTAGDPGLVNRRNSEGGQWSKGSFVTSSPVSTGAPNMGGAIEPAPNWNVSGLKRIGTVAVGTVVSTITHIGSGINPDNIQDAASKATQAAATWHQFGTIAMVLTAIAVAYALFSQQKKV